VTVPAALPPGRARIPWWRRVTAVVSLTSLVVIMGFVVAALLGLAALVMLLILDAAAG
jgi:hypothetical protein